MNRLKRFRNDRSGIGWILGVAILSIFFLPVVYFPLNMAWIAIKDVVTGGYTFTGTTALSIIVAQAVIDYALVFGLFFTVAWAVTQAKKERFNP